MQLKIVFGEPVPFSSLRPGLFAFGKKQDTVLCTKFNKVLRSDACISSFAYVTVQDGKPYKLVDKTQPVYPAELKQVDESAAS